MAVGGGVEGGETVLHTLGRVLEPRWTVGAVMGRYWARMGYGDWGHPDGRSQFLEKRGEVEWGNYEEVGVGRWKVKEERAPRYMGANITPFEWFGVKGLEGVGVKVRPMEENRVDVKAIRATAAVRNKTSGDVRYVPLENLTGSVVVSADEEAMLIVANAPDEPIYYETANAMDGPTGIGLLYEVEFGDVVA